MTFLQTIYHVLFVVWPQNPFIARQLLYGIIHHKLRKTKKDRSFRRKWHTVYYPSGIFGAGALEQIFVDEYYKPLTTCHHVLDMGGFFGESGIYLAHYCKTVDIYEPEPRLYQYIAKSTWAKSNITIYNKAVVARYNQTVYFDNAGWYSMCWHITDHKTWIEVQGIHIGDVLSKKHYDGIKMDIEWAEFEVIQRMNTNYDRSQCHQGYIEFHFFTKQQRDNIHILKDFLDHINQTHKNISFHGHRSKCLDLSITQLIQHLCEQKSSLVLVHFSSLRKNTLYTSDSKIK